LAILPFEKLHFKTRRHTKQVLITVLLSAVFSAGLVFSLAGSQLENKVATYVAAKCPGIPYGEYSGGPDYIDIAIDAILVAIFGWLLYLTVRDIRRKAKRQAPTKL
jgi:hypothetical protein